MLHSGSAPKSRLTFRLPIACLAMIGAASVGMLTACGSEAPGTGVVSGSPTENEGQVESAVDVTYKPVKIGVFRAGTWYFDNNGDRAWEPLFDTTVVYGTEPGAVGFVESRMVNAHSNIGYYTDKWLCRQQEFDTAGYPDGDPVCVPRDASAGTPVRTEECWTTFLNGIWNSSQCISPGFPNDPVHPGNALPQYFGGFGDTGLLGAWGGATDETRGRYDRTRFGTFKAGVFTLDLDGRPGDIIVTHWTAPGVPVVGDWLGSGATQVGTFDRGTWYLDLNYDGVWDPSVDGRYRFGQAGDVPVVGYWKTKGSIIRRPPGLN